MKRVAVVLLAATLLLITVGILVSSALPDGLKHVAAALGFASRSSTVGPGSPFANYEARWIHSRWAAQALAGLLGAGLVYGAGALFGRSLKRRREHAPRNSG